MYTICTHLYTIRTRSVHHGNRLASGYGWLCPACVLHSPFYLLPSTFSPGVALRRLLHSSFFLLPSKVIPGVSPVCLRRVSRVSPMTRARVPAFCFPNFCFSECCFRPERLCPLDAGCWLLDIGCWMFFKVQGSKFKVRGSMLAAGCSLLRHHKLSEYNPPVPPPSVCSGGALVPPWYLPIPIEHPTTPIFNQAKLIQSAFPDLRLPARPAGS